MKSAVLTFRSRFNGAPPAVTPPMFVGSRSKIILVVFIVLLSSAYRAPTRLLFGIAGAILAT
jgi:hypothetical protein